MIFADFGQYLYSLAILWGGFLLLSRIGRAVAVKNSILTFVLSFLRKAVLMLAIIATGFLVMFTFDVKDALAMIRNSVGTKMEFFLRNCIDLLFNTRSFFVVIQLLTNGFIAFSTTICGMAVFAGNLAYFCLVILHVKTRAAKLIPQKQQTVQTFTTNGYNFQRKYFIRA